MAALLVAVGVLVGVGGTRAVSHVSSDACTQAVASSANEKVADYQGPLVESCSTYSDFAAAHAQAGIPTAPFVSLVFCQPEAEPDTPTDVHQSPLCDSARSTAEVQDAWTELRALTASLREDVPATAADEPSQPGPAPVDDDAPPASAFVGQRLADLDWVFTVTDVQGTEEVDLPSVNGPVFRTVDPHVIGTLTNTSAYARFGDAFRLNVNGYGATLDVYVGSCVGPGETVEVAFAQDGGTVGGPGPIRRIDALVAGSYDGGC